MYRRHGLCFVQNVRHRSLAALKQRIPRDFFLLELRSVSGPPGRYSLQAKIWRQERLRSHLEWLWARRWPHMDRHRGKLSTSGRLDSDPRSAAPIHGHRPHSGRGLMQQCSQSTLLGSTGHRTRNDQCIFCNLLLTNSLTSFWRVFSQLGRTQFTSQPLEITPFRLTRPFRLAYTPLTAPSRVIRQNRPFSSQSLR